jgi:protein-disulfide isomerase
MFAKRILSLAVITAALLSAGLAVTSSRAQDAAAFDQKQTQAIEGIIRSYLLKNPEVLREAIGELNKRQEAEAAEKRKGALASLYKQDTPYSTGSGKVTVVEFFDYNCPYCTQAFKEVVKLTDSEKDMRVVFIEFPILSDESRKASEAAVAAAKQNKYWEFHRALMNKPGPATEDKALKVAAEIGLDVDRLKKDMESPETAEVLEKNLALGQSMGVQGTPAFFVGDEAIPGAPENLNKILSAAIKQTLAKGCSVC